MKGVEPVAMMRRSYWALMTLPAASLALTTRRARSASVTVQPLCSVMWCSAYQDQSLRMIWSMLCSPANAHQHQLRLFHRGSVGSIENKKSVQPPRRSDHRLHMRLARIQKVDHRLAV